MRVEWPWKSKSITVERDLAAVESRLAMALQPVAPRPEFIKDLRVKLVGKPKEEMSTVSAKKFPQTWLVVGGIFSFFAMVLTGVRIVVTILGLVEANKQAKKPARI